MARPWTRHSPPARPSPRYPPPSRGTRVPSALPGRPAHPPAADATSRPAVCSAFNAGGARLTSADRSSSPLTWRPPIPSPPSKATAIFPSPPWAPRGLLPAPHSPSVFLTCAPPARLAPARRGLAVTLPAPGPGVRPAPSRPLLGALHGVGTVLSGQLPPPGPLPDSAADAVPMAPATTVFWGPLAAFPWSPRA